jgi:hypothetical protein
MEILNVEGIDDDWDRFVRESPAGTIFHTLRFLSYHPARRFDFLNLKIRHKGETVCVIPGGRKETKLGTFYASPVGASFGGFVFADDSDLASMGGAIDTFDRKLIEMGFDRVEMVLAPSCYSQAGHQALGFCLTSAGYNLVGREATMVVPLRSVSREKLNPVLARNLRKAERSGVSVGVGGNLSEFYRILERNLGLKGIGPTHTERELAAIFELLGDRLVLLEARAEGKVVGGCLIFLCNPRIGLAFYICDDPEERHLRVAESVLWAGVEHLREAGYSHFDLGTVSIEGKINAGLLRFKSKFSTRTYVRERYIRVLRRRPS